jgi:predicted oxidoreductase
MARETTGQRWLRATALVFAAGFVLHNADHVRRDGWPDVRFGRPGRSVPAGTP